MKDYIDLVHENLAVSKIKINSISSIIKKDGKFMIFYGNGHTNISEAQYNEIEKLLFSSIDEQEFLTLILNGQIDKVVIQGTGSIGHIWKIEEGYIYFKNEIDFDVEKGYLTRTTLKNIDVEKSLELFNEKKY